MKLLNACMLAIVFLSCQSKTEELYATEILEQAIAAHGGQAYDPIELAFQFRDKSYHLKRDGGTFAYQRMFRDTAGQNILDHLDNEGFTRRINQKLTPVTDEWALKYGDALNSVVYFGLLPYFLRDEAVQAVYQKKRVIHNIPYHEIKVTFQEAGGGTDYEDEYLYWFRVENYYLDYFAYNYQVDGGGVRFRKAINPRTINGVRMQDYINYKPKSKDTPLEDLPDLLINKQLDSLSLINLIF